MVQPCVYILASQRNGTLYVGVTTQLTQRMGLHRSGAGSKFVRDYRVHKLVFVEFHESVAEAILRESGSRNGDEPGSLN